jgi:hypothetical protein
MGVNDRMGEENTDADAGYSVESGVVMGVFFEILDSFVAVLEGH